MNEFAWPQPTDATAMPVWTGKGFRIGTEAVPVLSYLGGSGGWSDELTELHEDVGGAAHPMDVASRARAIHELKKALPGSTSKVLLEVGCSSGYLLPELRENFPGSLVIGSDYVGGPLMKLAAQKPDIPLLRFDLVRCPLPDACVDGVVLLNVLEHIDDHEGAMKQLFRIVKPGGVVYIEVPAGPHLFDAYDKLLMHFRRYRMSELKALLKSIGFDLTAASHLGFVCYPGFWWTKRQNQKRGELTPEEQRQWVAKNLQKTRQSSLLRASLGIEKVMDRMLPLPWGIRCVVTCRKPSR